MAVATARRRMALALLDGAVPAGALDGASAADGRLLDRLVLSPWTGFVLVALVLYFGFYKFVGQFGAGTAVDWIDRVLFGRYITPVADVVARALIPWTVVRDLVTGPYGLISLGVRYAVAIVLPIVSAFFLVFALLEDSGYLPRLALLLDRALKRVGLSGRAVIPLVLGFGCNTMATLVTRTLETKRERVIATLLLALAIPCSAQLGVVLGILSVWPGAVAVWALVLVLVFLAVGRLAALFLPGEPPSFYLELHRVRIDFHFGLDAFFEKRLREGLDVVGGVPEDRIPVCSRRLRADERAHIERGHFGAGVAGRRARAPRRSNSRRRPWCPEE